ncbi:MAG: T9SS type A sorting domain-containing protein [Krumholzibacteria bacterium]|nr:T9SS type A sorting domain-containing protein [Candidatus Krumholzibacteria bacterium]
MAAEPRRRATAAAGLAAALFAALSIMPLPTFAEGARTIEPGDLDLITPPVRNGYSQGSLYFVVIDRIANGDPANDQGGIAGGPLSHGLEPTRAAYYHGGDLAGLESKLDYIEGLGVTAICVGPPLANKPVQGDGTLDGSSAGYHGEWPVNFGQIDPHFGSNTEMVDFIVAAQAIGLKVYFDIVVNHTADIIDYSGGDLGYRDKAAFPYRDAAGTVFDDRDYIGPGTFPALAVDVSFPYLPTFGLPGQESAKSPAWLNNRTLYHNRGASTPAGEGALYGDLDGCDDLFTEHPDAVAGMVAIYQGLITAFGIDGVRILDVDHVNDEFWAAFVPAIRAHAASQGKPDFAVIGEVSAADPGTASRFMTSTAMPALADRGFAAAVRQFVGGTGGGEVLRDLFLADDLYTDANGNAHDLITLVSDDDLGRVGWGIDQARPGAPDSERYARARLAHALRIFSRGTPLLTYGDEQGFVGDGGGADAHQDMFPSQVASYNDDVLIASGSTTADDNFDATHPLYQVIADMNWIRSQFPGLRSGAHAHCASDAAPGLYAFSRIDRGERVEYVVVANNATGPAGATVPTVSPSTAFVDVYPGTSPTIVSDSGGQLGVSLAGLGFAVYRAQSPIPASPGAPGITISVTTAGTSADDRLEVLADLDRTMFAEVTFAVSVGGGPFTVIGADDAAPYRVYYDANVHPAGTSLSFKAIVDDRNGHADGASVTFVTGATSAADQASGPARVVLHPAVPNPFNPETVLSFSLPVPGHARLRVFDVRGHLVRTLLDEPSRAGRHSVVWNGRDDQARPLASGVYFYRIETGTFAATERMVLLK